MNLSEGQISWIAEISASVLRNNQLRKAPDDWWEIPVCWRDSAHKMPLTPNGTNEHLSDHIGLAIKVLEALARAAPIVPKPYTESRF